MRRTATYCLRAFLLPIFMWAGIYTTCELFVALNRWRGYDPDPAGHNDISSETEREIREYLKIKEEQ